MPTPVSALLHAASNIFFVELLLIFFFFIYHDLQFVLLNFYIFIVFFISNNYIKNKKITSKYQTALFSELKKKNR